MRIHLKKPILYILYLLYPILPSYFGLSGWPVYTFLGLISSILLLGVTRKIRLYKEIKILLFAYVCMIVPVIRHQELVSVIFFCVDILLIVSCINCINSRDTLEKLIDIIIFAAIVLCILSYMEVIFDFNIFSLIENTDSVGGMGSVAQYRFSYRRAESSFSQSIGYAIYLTFASSFNFYKICTIKRNKRYVLYHLLITLAVILTFSRVPMILYFALQLYFLYIKGFKEGVKKTIGIIITLLLVIIISSALNFQITIIQDAINMILAMFDSETSSRIAGSFGNDNLNGWAYRLVLITELPRLLGSRWLLGGGQVFANGGFYTSLYKVGSIDNNYMTVLFRYGLIGLMGKMLYIISGLASSRKLCKAKEYKGIIFGRITLATLVVYLINWISVAELRESRMVLLYIIICVSYKIVSIEKESCTLNVSNE